jgi:hypothetical protein
MQPAEEEKEMIQSRISEEGTIQQQPEEEEESLQMQAVEQEEEEILQQPPVKEEEPLQMQPVEEEEEIVQSQVNEKEETIKQQQDDRNEVAVAETSGGENLHQQTENIQPAMPTPAFNAIQKLEEEEEEPAEIQASEDEERRPVMAEKEEQVQAKADHTPTVPEGFETGLNGSKGSGSPLPSGVKKQMESGFETDFSNVRIHTGSEAAQMSRQIGALAFTHGSDIYFNEGKFNPDSQSGQHLIAHELTHTVQQGATVKAKMIQKIDEPESPKTIDEVTEQHPSPKGVIEKSGNSVTLFLNGLKIKSNTPDTVTNSITLPYELPRSGSRESSPTQQVSIWNRSVAPDTDSSLRNLLEQIETDRPIEDKIRPANRYSLKLKRGSGSSLSGTFTQLKNVAKIPSWNRLGTAMTFQVEHILDYQIAGGAADQIENLILLESSINQSLGQEIKAVIRTHIGELLVHYNRFVATDELVDSADAARENANYSVKANSFDRSISAPSEQNLFYNTDFVPAATGNPLNPNLVEINSLEVPEGHFILKSSASAAGIILPYSATNLEVGSLSLSLDGNEQDGISSIIATPIIEGDHLEEQLTSDRYNVTRSPGTHIYQVESSFGRRQIMRGLRLKYLSLMEFDDPQFDEFFNLRVTGRINAPSPAFLGNSPIEISIIGKTISISKTFSANELTAVGPFVINYASLTLGLNNETGLTASGSVGFSIAGVGSGTVEASASQGNLMLNGNFGFEKENIDGSLEMHYASNLDHESTVGESSSTGESAWGIQGNLTLRNIRGVRTATINVGYENETITGSATSIELEVPGITVERIFLSYGVDSENFEFTISAGTSRIPGIQSANITATISSGGNGEEGSGSGDLALNLSGTATFRSIPGLQNPTLTISYNSQSGVIDISGNLEFERGKVSGSVTVGVTNRQVSDGIARGEAGENLFIYGDGQLSIAITDEFTPQLGARLTPEGDILINGWINVDLQLGDGYQRERTLFGINVTPIPIFTIGIAQVLLTAGGSLGVYANINPVSIDGRIGFEDFNPANPDSFQAVMEVTARASAEAGLKFDAYLGIMASAAIIYAEGRLVVETRVGAEAGAEITGGAAWSAARGFEITNATANLDLNIRANASLVLHVGAGIYLYVSRVEVISHDFLIASTDFPPLAQMQASMPVNFQNGSLSEINAQDITIRNNPLDNPQSAGRFLQEAVTDVESGPQETEVTNEKNRIISEIQQYPSIGPANPDYYVLYGKQFLVEELKNNNPGEDWSWLDEELANMEYSEFIDFRTYILSQPCSASRIYEVQMFGINHPSISSEDMNILETELQEQEDECLLGADVPNDTDI